MRKMKKSTNESGFTLIELLIAMSITAIVMAALIAVFSSQQESYAIESEKAKNQAHARAALYMMARDVKMAGYTGLALGGADMADDGDAMPVVSVGNDGQMMTGWPLEASVVSNAEGDVIEVWGNFRRQISELTSPATSGQTSITISNPDAYSGTGINRPG